MYIKENIYQDEVINKYSSAKVIDNFHKALEFERGEVIKIILNDLLENGYIKNEEKNCLYNSYMQYFCQYS